MLKGKQSVSVGAITCGTQHTTLMHTDLSNEEHVIAVHVLHATVSAMAMSHALHSGGL